jgi:hypothetical protein
VGPEQGPFALTKNDCGSDFLGRGSCTLEVTFRPPQPGPYEGRLSVIGQDGPLFWSEHVALRGVGLGALDGGAEDGGALDGGAADVADGAAVIEHTDR